MCRSGSIDGPAHAAKRLSPNLPRACAFPIQISSVYKPKKQKKVHYVHYQCPFRWSAARSLGSAAFSIGNHGHTEGKAALRRLRAALQKESATSLLLGGLARGTCWGACPSRV